MFVVRWIGLGLGLVVAGCSSGGGDADHGADGGSAASGDRGDFGKLCQQNSDCKDGVCIFQTGREGSGLGSCTRACTSASDCPPNVLCEPLDNGTATVCVSKEPCTRYAMEDPICRQISPSLPAAFQCPDMQQAPASCSQNGTSSQFWCCPPVDDAGVSCSRNNGLDMFCGDPMRPKGYECPSNTDPPASQDCKNDPSLNLFCCAH
jgi:hypothetical protein